MLLNDHKCTLICASTLSVLQFEIDKARISILGEELPSFNDADTNKNIVVLKTRKTVQDINQIIDLVGGEEMKESEEIPEQAQLENCDITFLESDS